MRVDWVGLALMITAIGTLQMTMDLGESRNWFASKLIQVSAVAALIIDVAFVWRGWSKRDNFIDFAIMKDRSFAAANVAIMGFGVSVFGSITILPLFVQGRLGYPIIDAGFWNLVWPGVVSGLGMGLFFVPMSYLCWL